MSTKEKPTRVSSVDAYRGLVMFLMMAEVLELSEVAKSLKTSAVWNFLALHQTHVEWVGCSLHDMIQPSFSFLVGVALPFSLANRLARGQSLGWATGHAALRAVILVLLGVFLRSVGHPQTNFTFEDTLSQIGFGYFPLFLIALCPRPVWWAALAVILVGYWGAFAWYPLPGPDFNYALAGVPPDWPYNLSGFAAHWNKNTNFAWWFDTKFLNLFPRERPFHNNGGGYATLSFIPTLGTMILGLIAGGWLHDAKAAWKKVLTLIAAGCGCLAAGLAAHYLGICPIVKRIWTPAWVLYSGGWCFLLMAAFYLLLDIGGWPACTFLVAAGGVCLAGGFAVDHPDVVPMSEYISTPAWVFYIGGGFLVLLAVYYLLTRKGDWRAWAFPLRVIGMNSIAAYLLAHAPFAPFFHSSLLTHLRPEFFKTWGDAYEPFALGVGVLAVEWLILFWMYRRGIFLRI
jgi:predicted acyltransferase